MNRERNTISPDTLESFSLRQRHLAMIRSILDREFAGPDCKIYLFGSRAWKTASPASDVDLAIKSAQDMHARIARAYLAFEESDLPFTVDLVDLTHASPSLKREVQEYGHLIWES